MASSQAPTSTATMLAGFPQMVAKIIGEPTLQDVEIGRYATQLYARMIEWNIGQSQQK